MGGATGGRDGATTASGDLVDATDGGKEVVGVPEGVATRLDVIVTVITVLVVVGVTTRGVTTGGVTTGGMAVHSTKAASLTPSTGGNRGSTTTGLDALLKGELRGLERVRAPLHLHTDTSLTSAHIHTSSKC